MNVDKLVKGISMIPKSLLGANRLKKKIKEEVHIEPQNVITLINTETGSDNLGDSIIMHYAREALADILDGEVVYEVASHLPAFQKDIDIMKSSKAVIVCGTNFLSPHMESYTVWKFDKEMIQVKNLVLLAVGYMGYRKSSGYSKLIYRTLLRNGFIHSVRDQYTADRLRDMGISNVLNTNCVTLWGGAETYREIPRMKSSAVVFTVTSYKKDILDDKYLINLCQKYYKKIYFWPQADGDLEYFKGICTFDNIEIIDRTIEAYDAILSTEDIDYIGSRLHGGIYALRHGRRTIIIAVDNRASEIKKDTSIPVISSSEMKEKLENLILSEWETKIYLNEASVKQWKTALKKKLSSSET